MRRSRAERCHDVVQDERGAVDVEDPDLPVPHLQHLAGLQDAVECRQGALAQLGERDVEREPSSRAPSIRAQLAFW